jgi:hypothetical protein
MSVSASGCRVAWGIAAGVVCLTLAREGHAAPPWVDRGLTLPRGDWAFDLGLGIGHIPNNLGPGFNFEVAAGLTHALQLGVRTGLRFTGEARAADADAYGRPFDTETYGQGNGAVANPEILLRGGLIDGRVVEFGLEGRVYVPFQTGFGLMVGLPLAFHLGRSARIDTGVYVPVLFYEPTRTAVSFPFHLWFQITDRLWLGPLSGFRFNNPGRDLDVPLGFGLGYSVTRQFDFKTWLLFRDVTERRGDGEIPDWGLGAGIEVRIE